MTAHDARQTDDVSGAARPAVVTEEPADGAEAERLGSSPTEEAGGHELPDDPEPETLDPPPQVVADLSSACVRFVAARYGVTLDFSPDTLSLVDQWIRDASAERGGRAELTELVQAAAGAYLGEVIRRAFGGTWLTSAGEMADWKLCLSTVYCAFNPIGMAREAILLEEAEGWHTHFEVDPAERETVEQRLAALPEVRDDEFYAPSTRFDVVEILVEALRAAMDSRGLSRVRFTVDDYR
ncbi:MAG TPA: hypothetical protein VEK07_20435 [Polyangiaceae bacterium]|nr:hypothetical protein [Polyangiaceae bacterium]